MVEYITVGALIKSLSAYPSDLRILIGGTFDNMIALQHISWGSDGISPAGEALFVTWVGEES